MDAIGSSPIQPNVSANSTSTLNETPKKSEEVPTVNSRENVVQETPDNQANSTTADSQQQQSGGSGNSPGQNIDQQLRQTAVRSSAAEQSSEPAQTQASSQQAISTFKAVEQFESGNTAAVTDTAGLAAQA